MGGDGPSVGDLDVAPYDKRLPLDEMVLALSKLFIYGGKGEKEKRMPPIGLVPRSRE